MDASGSHHQLLESHGTRLGNKKHCSGDSPPSCAAAQLCSSCKSLQPSELSHLICKITRLLSWSCRHLPDFIFNNSRKHKMCFYWAWTPNSYNHPSSFLASDLSDMVATSTCKRNVSEVVGQEKGVPFILGQEQMLLLLWWKWKVSWSWSPKLPLGHLQVSLLFCTIGCFCFFHTRVFGY